MNDGQILAIDEGTTNAKAILVDQQGRILANASRPLSVTYPQPAWVEQDPLAIWHNVQSVVAEVAQSASDIAAIAISNQRETVILWERERGVPIGPGVVWQCQRGARLCQKLKEAGYGELVRERTGLTLDTMFSASKMRWLLDNAPDGKRRAENGELCIGTVDSWVLYNLTGGRVFACDTTNASRTLLLNIHDLTWDEDLCAAFGIPVQSLPSVRPSSSVYGHTHGVAGVADGIPVASLVGDSHASMFGHAGFHPGSIKATYGTGTSLMTPVSTPIQSKKGLSTTVAWSTEAGATYALEGNIYISAAVVPWVGELFGMDDAVEEVSSLANSVSSSSGVYLVPAFVGLGAPHWSESARGILTGLTQGTTEAHVARAALEAIAYQIRDIFDAMQAEADSELTVLLADGGASRNELLMQFQADILGCPVLRSTSAEVSALGAAYLAGLATGIWSSQDEIAELPRDQTSFAPKMNDQERAFLYSGWQKAIAQAVLV